MKLLISVVLLISLCGSGCKQLTYDDGFKDGYVTAIRSQQGVATMCRDGNVRGK